MFPIPHIVWESHWNVKAVWSLGKTQSFSWWLCIDSRASVASMGNTLKFRQISSLTGQVKDFSQWGGGKQEREVRCPTRNSPLSRSQCWSGETLTLTAPLEQGPLSGSPWVIQLSSVYSKIKFTTKSLGRTDDKLNYSPEFSLMKSALLSKSWVYFGTWGDGTTLHVFSWVIFCINAFKYAY